ncbi:MAG: YchF/TatD family DNA exonuclease [Deltaproteobacteria bacterium]|nr:YchF/TatD family DNA exonuclease [Deltaproteobacteria bacterium]
MEKDLFIDTHAHLDDKRFDADRDDVIKRAGEAGLKCIVTVVCWKKEGGFDWIREIPRLGFPVFVAAGVHPHEAALAGAEAVELLKGLKGDIKAIGETGLDYHYTNSPRDAQRDIFIRQIRLAREMGMPLIVHSREADDDTVAILRGEGAEEAGGVIHCFSGTERMAEEALEMGFYISFTGVVTFPKAGAAKAAVKAVPIERMLIETDCPYLAPVPHRGKRCEPAFVVETARKIAELKGLSLSDVARITTLNAEGLFGLVARDGVEPEAKVAYVIRDGLYLNITNRCTNYCTFCAKFKSYTVKGHYLKLKKEPDFMDIVKAAGPEAAKYSEVVFCGFGEPLIRLDLVRKDGLHFKKMGCRIRIDTDGLANLVHGKNVLPELMFVDCLSVSLNAPDSGTYQGLCKTPFGDRAYPAILWFLKEAKKYVPKVVATVVAVPGLDVEACRRVAVDEIGVGFRVREYDEVG